MILSLAVDIVNAAIPTPGPTASSSGADEGAAEAPSYLFTIVIPLTSAALGSVLTLVGEWLIRRYAKSRSRARMVAMLLLEVADVSRSAIERVSANGQLILLPPLPNTAWEAMRSSNFINELKSDQIQALVNLYSAVDAANYQSVQVPLLTQTSALATDDDTAREFRDEAMRLSTQPFEPVDSLAARVIASFSSLETAID